MERLRKRDRGLRERDPDPADEDGLREPLRDGDEKP